MKLSFLFARRYLFSRKSLTVINIISVISSFTVAIPVMAMVVLLSVFNGFDTLIKSMYENFDADIKISVINGKFFDSSEISLASVDGVDKTGFIIEENALLEYRDKQAIGTIKGVDTAYSQIVPIESMVIRGEYRLRFGDFDQAIVGQSIATNLMVQPALNEAIGVYVPRRGGSSSILPMDIYRSKTIYPCGVFALDNEADGKYIIVPIDFARDLLELDSTKVSAAVVKLKKGADPSKVRSEIASAVGENFKVQTRYQQKESFYQIMQYEKWGIYFITLMVLLIASFSIVGSLVMIIIDKQKDIATLVTLGADRRLIRSIFLNEGMLISGIGAVLGVILGVAVCVLQQKFGFVKMAGTSFLIDAYPVEMRFSDIISVAVSVAAINLAICWFTVTKLIGKNNNV